MNYQLPKHEKIRFRRHEITNLAGMPSAAGQDYHWRPVRRGGPVVRFVLTAIAATATVLGVCAALIILLGLSGWGTETLRAEAEKAIETMAGVDIDARVGPARIAFDGSRLLALELRDVDLRTKGSDSAMIHAGYLRFGVRLAPLLSGTVTLGSLKISDARIEMDAMPANGNTDWTKVLRNEQGLLDPDRLAQFVFAQLHAGFDAVEGGTARDIEIENVDFVLPEGERIRVVRIDSGSLSRSAPGLLSIDAVAHVDGRELTISGSATRDPTAGRIVELDLDVAATPLDRGTDERPRQSLSQLGGFDIRLSGAEGDALSGSRLGVRASLQQSVLDLGARGAFTGNMDVDAVIVEGSNKVEINRLNLVTGRSSFVFNGAVGPRPPSTDEQPAYRYELVSDSAILAPDGSPEPALNFASQIRGTFDPKTSVLTANDMAVRAGQGEALGTARVEFLAGKAPGIALAFSVSDMQVSHAKQLWPWFAAGRARQWAFDRLFGGRLNDSQIQFRVQPGRLGNGVPLSAEEVSGHFEISGSRFDTAGLLPPVRDAIGVIDVRGNDVDVALSSGTVYLPSGKTVAASNGTLRVVKANVRPVIGKLEIDVAGDAAAITEFASYEPINAMRHIGMTPDQFTGSVTGHVSADIPMHKGIDPKTLNWMVVLDYKVLAIAKPFDGQMVTEADGTIVIEPDRATVSARALLNGVPSEIDLIEPLRPDGPERQRKVQLILDDKARNTLAPGLSVLVSGPVKVQLDAREGLRTIKADLTDAKLDIPWAGWTKGPGIAASAEFGLKSDGATTSLSDLKISGDTFSITGSASLVKGALSSARFDKVRLNRGDDVAVTVKQTGSGYTVGVSGSALDARALIKQAISDTGVTKGASDRTAVSLDLNVGTVLGFNDESLSGVKLNYRGAGSSVDAFDLTATAKSGAAVTATNATTDGGKTLQMQSSDAGAVLRFLDIYDHMQGGSIKLAMAGKGNGPMVGQVDARDFFVVDEPKLASLVSTPAPGSDRSLNQAVRREIDTSRVQFERGYAQISKGDGYLDISNGVLRGPLIGSTFQGTLYDKKGRMDMTGTFMPAYGLNRLFGELPLIGVILGNGRDRGLIGVTYKLEGDAKSPALSINPLSVIAPGIFRSIFEFQ